MRRVLALVLALLAAGALTPATAAASTPTNRLIGGVDATGTDVPWQALVLPNGYLCGGAILDQTHVVTAAHCVYDEQHGSVTAPSAITVHAGITNRLATGQAPTVVAVSVNPAYNPSLQINDVAVLTLAGPGFTYGPTVQAIPLTDVGYKPTAGDDLRLSGWGSDVARAPEDATTVPHAVDDLQVASALHLNSSCATVYAPFPDDLLLCAGEGGLDACQGDSGGPLAVQVGGVFKLAGIVTGGAGCAWPGYPGYYARVAHQGIHDFLTDRGIGYAIANPVNLTRPAITGTPKPGGLLTCDYGQWTNAYAYDVGFTLGGALFSTGQKTLLVTRGMVGSTVGCVVEAWGLTASAEAQSATVTIAGDPAQPVVPEQPTVVAPAPAAPVDATAPTVKVGKVRCTRTVCLLDVRAEDPAPSVGVKTVEGRVATAYRATCVKHRKRRRCTKTATQKLKTQLVGPAVYRLTTPKMRTGKHAFALLATDLNGNRQTKPTTLTRTTR